MKMNRNVGFGGSLFLIAVGAILAFAVSVQTEGFNLNTIGMILMIVGGIGVVLSLVAMNTPDKTERTDYVRKDVDIDSRDR
jgi:hypothetical protein